MALGKIIIHIGLPKTATTTLQSDVFPVICSGEVKYAGVLQPRKSNIQGQLYTAIYQSIGSGLNYAMVRGLLERELESGSTIIISEEMITVSDSCATWCEKISNLSNILRGFNYSIIVTVREPISAMFSYYCELFPTFSSSRATFLNAALEHEAMGVFRYSWLIEELLDNFDRKRISMFKFEDIVAGDLNDLIHLINPDYCMPETIKLSKHNSRYTRNNSQSTRHYKTPLDYLRNNKALVTYKNNKVFSYLVKLVRPLLYFMGKIRIKKIYVDIPSDEELRIVRDSMQNDIRELADYFGIVYD